VGRLRVSEQETFFGHFLRADNGNDYAVAGKGFHAIYLFKGGFAFDFRYRTNARAKAELTAGDRRIVFGRVRDALELDAPPLAPGQRAWSAEVFLPWSRLGFAKGPDDLKCDFGLLVPDSGGITVDRRLSWVAAEPLPVSDVGWEAGIDPAAWATMDLR
jgi:hypothetical protein